MKYKEGIYKYSEKLTFVIKILNFATRARAVQPNLPFFYFLLDFINKIYLHTVVLVFENPQKLLYHSTLLRGEEGGVKMNWLRVGPGGDRRAGEQNTY